MRFRLPITLVLTIGVLAAIAPSALGATPNQIIRDALDGVIDGKYTAKELRAADRAVSPEEREYYLWDEAYADALRRLNNPDAAPLPVVPVKDFDGDGKVSADDVKEARKRTDKLRDKVKKQNPDDFKDLDEDDEFVVADDDDEGGAVASKGKDDGGSDGGAGWLTALLFAIPAAVIGMGTWRMQRSRAKGSKAKAAVTAGGPAGAAVAGKPGSRSKKRAGKPAKAKAPKRKPSRGKPGPDLGTNSSFASGDDLK